MIANLEQIHRNDLPSSHITRDSTPLTEEKPSVKEFSTLSLGVDLISARDITKLKEWPTFSGEGEYNHVEFIRTIYMLQEDFDIPDKMIVGKLHSLFTRTSEKWYYKMRKENFKQHWIWWKSEIITKWGNNSSIFKMETAFESSIFNSYKD
ncbi:hypothetical protein O181_059109 [Austropuccinia psidii MF-1]|uniref:Uncharacterized protein n=1 Tax=Austropuccinia psidii MF-1 TaxID=1389203 RepID=A0A9Q3EDS7_9BASI|nr:hypothetical protein [Austropuccinia psidii MF-1]